MNTNTKPFDNETDKDISCSECLENDSEKLLISLSQTEEEIKQLFDRLADEEKSEKLSACVNDALLSLSKSEEKLKQAQKRTKNIKKELAGRFTDHKFENGARLGKVSLSLTSNASVDKLESKSGHFTKGLGFYKLFWLCFIGAFCGVVIEMIWWYLKYAKIDSRVGLVWGPFNMLYGCGAVILTLCLYKVRNQSFIRCFILGTVVGSVFEYACSYFQELIFGSVSWSYHNKPFNINGRICLLYSLLWGILSVVWIKSIYPSLSKLLLKIPQKLGKPLTWILFTFIIVNGIVTILATYRWSQRIDGVTASNVLWDIFDMRFANERMKALFPNMKF